MSETRLSKAIEAAIIASTGGRCIVLRLNAGGFRSRMKGLPPGTPDRAVVLPRGRVLWVEVKAPGKIPSGNRKLTPTEEAQTKWRDKALDLGHAVVTVDSVKAAVAAVRKAMA